MKNAPIIAASPVRTMGFARIDAARTTASISGCPNATSALMKSTSRIEFRTIMPASAIIPIIEVAVKFAPSSAWPGITPMIVKGMGAMMISGTAYERNCATTRR